ncbi:hypothetical protein BDV29DRAFT_161025 [Aspergillus leporis]|uniref:Fork-head domain-containing protein n=1 Tax=Aspergillus leporis TaxID=41062 RepID=A0A5N5WRL7_9EURO|nr:hypothetical protein BDV29DRAFT_161025 [Aspergillus leporis]
MSLRRSSLEGFPIVSTQGDDVGVFVQQHLYNLFMSSRRGSMKGISIFSTQDVDVGAFVDAATTRDDKNCDLKGNLNSDHPSSEIRDNDLQGRPSTAPDKRLEHSNPETGSLIDGTYAALLVQCFQCAPQGQRSFIDACDWIERFTRKCKNPRWREVVQNTLKRNPAFELVGKVSSTKCKAQVWRLTGEAKRHGVRSKTSKPGRKPSKASKT